MSYKHYRGKNQEGLILEKPISPGLSPFPLDKDVGFLGTPPQLLEATAAAVGY